MHRGRVALAGLILLWSAFAMAIGSNSAVENFGTQTEVISIAGAVVSDGGYSDAGDLTAWSNTDNVVEAAFVLDATFAVAPGAGTTVDLYGRPLDVSDGTEDQTVPSDDFPATYLGSFPLNDAGTATIATITAGLPNVVDTQQYEFYVKNNSGQALSIGSTVDIIPKAIVPKA